MPALFFYMARWSSGQDGGLSRRKREFDSPTGHQKVLTNYNKCVIVKKLLRAVNKDFRTGKTRESASEVFFAYFLVHKKVSACQW